MPTTQEFTILADQNTLMFIGLVVRLFLGLVMVLAFAFSFVIVVLYCSGKVLIFTYTIMTMMITKIRKQEATS